MKQIPIFDNKEELLNDIERNKEKIIELQEVWNQDLLSYLRGKHKQNQAIFVPGNVPSQKNSKEIGIINTKNSVCCNALLVKKANKVWECSECKQIAQRKTITTLRSSDLVLEYKKVTSYIINTKIGTWKKMIEGKQPYYNVGFYFIRKSKNTWDWVNACQVLLDLIKDEKDKKGNIIPKWIKDDNMLYIKPYFLGYHYDKKNPGVIITLMDEYLIKQIL